MKLLQTTPAHCKKWPSCPGIQIGKVAVRFLCITKSNKNNMIFFPTKTRFLLEWFIGQYLSRKGEECVFIVQIFCMGQQRVVRETQLSAQERLRNKSWGPIKLRSIWFCNNQWVYHLHGMLCCKHWNLFTLYHKEEEKKKMKLIQMWSIHMTEPEPIRIFIHWRPLALFQTRFSTTKERQGCIQTWICIQIVREIFINFE